VNAAFWFGAGVSAIVIVELAMIAVGLWFGAGPDETFPSGSGE